MRWKASTELPRSSVAYRERWHRWFAWYPVKVEECWVWLEVVHRKGKRACGYGGDHWEWEYRARESAEWRA